MCSNETTGRPGECFPTNNKTTYYCHLFEGDESRPWLRPAMFISTDEELKIGKLLELVPVELPTWKMIPDPTVFEPEVLESAVMSYSDWIKERILDQAESVYFCDEKMAIFWNPKRNLTDDPKRGESKMKRHV